MDIQAILLTLVLVLPGAVMHRTFAFLQHQRRTADTATTVATGVLFSFLLYLVPQTLGWIDLVALYVDEGSPLGRVLEPHIMLQFLAITACGAILGALAGLIARHDSPLRWMQRLLGQTLEGGTWGPLVSRATGRWVCVTDRDGRMYLGIVVRCSAREDEGQIVLQTVSVYTSGEWEELEGTEWFAMHVRDVSTLALVSAAGKE